jgi:TonB-linked SusC/RagA family outer membrane protein
MKKNCETEIDHFWFIFKKALFAMKLTAIVFLISTFSLMAGGTYSQNTRISLNLKNVQIKEVLQKIEDNTEFFFIYNNQFVDVDKAVSVTVENQKVVDVLTNIFKDQQVEFQVTDRKIVIAPSFMTNVQQPSKVSGKITDSSRASLPGVTVVVKGTTNGTITDANGNYSLSNIPENATLQFSFVGMKGQEVAVGSKTTINVTLAEEAIGIEEVVAVGYGTQKKATITGSISTVKAESLKASSSTNFTNSFAGRLPGLVVVTRSGEPGNDNSTFRIRGSNTLGDNSPLIVIDGIANRSMQRLNPDDIESVTVLKDASAAIYGAQAANGVILITTKRGELGKSKTNVTFNQGWSMPTVLPKMADAATYATMLNEIDVYAGRSARYTTAQIQKFADGSDPWAYPNTDWIGTTFKPSAMQQTANFSVTGGFESLKYFVSLGGNYQDAIYKNSATNYSQFNFRSNIDGKISKNINLSLDIAGRQENRNYPTRSASSIFSTLMRSYPTQQAFWPTGENGPDLENGSNPVVITTNQTGYDKDIRYIFESNLKLNITIPWVKGLSVSANGSIDKNIQNRKVWETPWYLYSWNGTSYDSNGIPVLAVGKKGLPDPQLSQSMSDGSRSTYNGLIS